MYIGFFADVWDTVAEDKRKAVGIMEADSFSKATERITNFYEAENIDKIELIPLVRDYVIMSIDADSPYGENLADVIYYLAL